MGVHFPYHAVYCIIMFHSKYISYVNQYVTVFQECCSFSRALYIYIYIYIYI
jgi:hypothetical protein